MIRPQRGSIHNLDSVWLSKRGAALPFEFSKRGPTGSGVSGSESGLPAVLIVEDDPGTRELLERELTRSGYDAFLVSSGREARQAMEALVFPIAVIDRTLEDADGIELIAELRKRYAGHRIYIILFSALDSVEEQARGIKAGADAYVSKMSFPSALLSELSKATDVVRLNKR
jgi:CheY-like chemotaxis protein